MSARIQARKMERLEEHYGRIKNRENFRNLNIEKWEYVSKFSVIILIIDFIVLSYFLLTEGLSPLFIISLNLPFISFVIYFLLIFIAYVSKYKRRFYSSEMALTLEEVLFLRFLELYKKANRVSKEKEGILRKKYRKELVNKFESIREIVNSYGSINMSLINGIIGDEIDKFKLNFDEYLYSNIIMGDESDLNNVCRFLFDISEYMLNPRLDSLKQINKQIQDWLDPKDYETDWVAKIRIFAYERPLTSRSIFSSIFILLTILIGLYLQLDIPYLYSGFFASAIASFKVFDLIFKEEYKDARPTLSTSPDTPRSPNSQIVPTDIEELDIPEPSYPSDRWEFLWFKFTGDNADPWGDFIKRTFRSEINFNLNWEAGEVGETGLKDLVGFRASRTMLASARRIMVVGEGVGLIVLFKFEIGGDDGIRLFVYNMDSSEVFNIPQGWKDQGYTPYPDTVRLPEGDYKILLEWYERDGEARASFDFDTEPH